MLIKFKVRDNPRFLSHAETVKVFQRACGRAGIKIQYSQGFNPRPKLYLPLPRSVGVETDDDLLCLRVNLSNPRTTTDESQIKASLTEQLPDGFELLSVRTVPVFTEVASSPQQQRAKILPQAITATYVLPLQRQYINEELKSRIRYLLTSKSLNLQRQTDHKKSKFKDVDVRPFLKSLQLNDGNIAVECKISPAGSIRIDEILKLLQLDAENLAAPIRRKKVQWQ